MKNRATWKDNFKGIVRLSIYDLPPLFLFRPVNKWEADISELTSEHGRHDDAPPCSGAECGEHGAGNWFVML